MTKNYGEIVCMATKLFSFSLCHGTCFPITKVTMFDEDKQETVTMFDEGKQETMTMGCFTKCGDMTMGPST
jgi:hypothetical protein